MNRQRKKNDLESQELRLEKKLFAREKKLKPKMKVDARSVCGLQRIIAGPKNTKPGNKSETRK